jgi:hypothetical protein
VDEIVRSLGADGETPGALGREVGRASCRILPDKETPLWAPDEPPIYYWAADEYNEHQAYFVSYNGEGINHQPKSGETSGTAIVLCANPSPLVKDTEKTGHFAVLGLKWFLH